MDLAEIGASLRAARVRAGMTQAELAKAAGLGRTTVNQLENGVVPDIGLRKVLMLLDQLGMTIETKPRPAPRNLNELQHEQEAERLAAQRTNDQALGAAPRRNTP